MREWMRERITKEMRGKSTKRETKRQRDREKKRETERERDMFWPPLVIAVICTDYFS